MRHSRPFICAALLLLLGGCSANRTTDKPLPDYAQAYQDYLSLGVQYLQRGRYDLAEIKLKRAIEIDSKPPEAWNALAILYEQVRDVASGYQVYQKLTQSHPDYLLGYVNFATFLCKFNRRAELEQLYQNMRSKGADFSAVSYISQGDCALRNHQTSSAMTAYQQALTFNPYAAGALLPLAHLYLTQGDAAQALRYLNTIHTYIGYSAESVGLGIRAARMVKNRQLEQRLENIMRSSYAQSAEARELGLSL